MAKNKQESYIEEEKFTDSMSDEDLRTQIDAWELESQSVYQELITIWKHNLDYYKGNQTKVELIAGRQSKAVENRIFMAVETMIPIATSRLPDIEVRSGAEDEKSQMDANDLQDIIGFHMERVRIQALAERFLRYMIVLRYGVFKIDWDNDDVDLRVIDSRRIRIPKYGRNVDELKFVIEDLELTYDDLVDFFGEKKAKEVKEEGAGKNIQSESDIEPKKVRKATFTVKEIWTNELTVWRAGSLILDKKPNQFYNFEKKSKANFL